MSLKTVIGIPLLFIVYTVAFSIQIIFFPLPLEVVPADGQSAMLSLGIHSLAMTATLAFLARQGSLTGIRLFAAMLLFVWGTQTFMTQIETWYFREAFPTVTSREILFLFLRNLVTLMITIPLAQILFSRPGKSTPIPLKGARSWAWQLPLLGMVYMALYVIFGYFVAWQFEAVRLFYSASQGIDGFIEQWAATIKQKPLIIPFQITRGIAWALLTVPLSWIVSGPKKLLVCAGIFFAFLPTVGLIFHNPYMPAPVRLAHFVEVSLSTGLFGVLSAWVLSRESR